MLVRWRKKRMHHHPPMLATHCNCYPRRPRRMNPAAPISWGRHLTCAPSASVKVLLRVQSRLFHESDLSSSDMLFSLLVDSRLYVTSNDGAPLVIARMYWARSKALRSK